MDVVVDVSADVGGVRARAPVLGPVLPCELLAHT